MNIYLHHIETAVPEYAYSQKTLSDTVSGWANNPREARLARNTFRRSEIETRYSVLPDFDPSFGSSLLFHCDADGHPVVPDTGTRNRCFATEASRLNEQVSRRLFERAPWFKPQDVTHLITVSCTGFYNPGPDIELIQQIGLPTTIERYHLGFMGCYAAFPAMRMAKQFCEADPNAVVLIVCLELCTLHMQLDSHPDSMLANSLFADGAAATLVSAKKPASDRPVLTLGKFQSALASEGVGDMAWDIGSHGFNLRLSKYVPQILGLKLGDVVEELLGNVGMTLPDITHWAVHPGGRAILDKIENTLNLTDLQASRKTLRNYGNMSSVTIWFVLLELLQSSALKTEEVCAMAFGPGLTIETATLTLHSPTKTQYAPAFRMLSEPHLV